MSVVDSHGHWHLLSYAVHPTCQLAFLTVEYIMREVLQYAHDSGAIMFFLVVRKIAGAPVHIGSLVCKVGAIDVAGGRLWRAESPRH